MDFFELLNRFQRPGSVWQPIFSIAFLDPMPSPEPSNVTLSDNRPSGLMLNGHFQGLYHSEECLR